jgi:HK97 family phage portal protein
MIGFLEAVLGPPGRRQSLSGDTATQATPPSWFVEWVRGGEPTVSGVSVTENSALNYSAVWAATLIISETIAMVPRLLYRRISDTAKKRDNEHPVYKLINDEPNPEMDSATFWSEIMPDVVNWGYGLAEKEIAARGGRVLALWPVSASRATPRRAAKAGDGIAQNELYFEIRNEDGSFGQPLPFRNTLVIPGRMPQNGIGRGVIRHARESIGMGLATEQFGAGFFGNGAHPGGFIEIPKETRLSEDRVDALLDSFNRRFQTATKAGKVGVLRDGWTWKPNFIPPEDAQFLQTRQHNITEIARWYRIPPHLLADLTRATFSNIESELSSFLTYSMQPWFCKVEQAITRQLLTATERQTLFIEFLIDALLRADTVARAQAHQIEFMNGALTIDEWRAHENRNPLAGGKGDTHFVPGNLLPLDRALMAEEPSQQAPPLPNDRKQGPQNPQGEQPAQPEDEMRAELARQRQMWSERRKQGARQAIAESMLRMIHKEQQAAKRAANKPVEFLAWSDRFYGEHVATVADAIRPALRTYLDAIEVLADAAELSAVVSASHCGQSHQLLLTASECQPEQLAASVAACVETWTDRINPNIEEHIHG